MRFPVNFHTLISLQPVREFDLENDQEYLSSETPIVDPPMRYPGHQGNPEDLSHHHHLRLSDVLLILKLFRLVRRGLIRQSLEWVVPPTALTIGSRVEMKMSGISNWPDNLPCLHNTLIRELFPRDLI